MRIKPIVAWILGGVALVMAFVVTILVSRSLTFNSRQLPPEPIAASVPVNEGVSGRLAEAIRFQTISTDRGVIARKYFERFHAFLGNSFPKTHLVLTREFVNQYSVLYRWQGTKSELLPIMLSAHIDVVPVDARDVRRWTYPPFAGQIADGYIWGRGTMDMKGSLMGILEAVESLIAKGFQPTRTIYIAFGHDEEIGGHSGAAEIARQLNARGIRFDFVLDEGGAIVKDVIRDVSRPVAAIGIAEKGYISLALSVESSGGHSMSPPASTAIGILSKAIYNLEQRPFPSQLNNATRQMFEYLGPEMPWPKKMVFANTWLFGPFIRAKLEDKSTTNALVRSTIAATIFRAGDKENSLPSKAEAIVNIRVLPGDGSNLILRRIAEVIDDERVTLRILRRDEPSPVSDVGGTGFVTLQHTIRDLWPGVLVAPSQVLGGSDARHYQSLANNVYRFAPLIVDTEDLRRIHGIDERLSIIDYQRLIVFYIRLIESSTRWISDTT